MVNRLCYGLDNIAISNKRYLWHKKSEINSYKCKKNPCAIRELERPRVIQIRKVFVSHLVTLSLCTFYRIFLFFCLNILRYGLLVINSENDSIPIKKIKWYNYKGWVYSQPPTN